MIEKDVCQLRAATIIQAVCDYSGIEYHVLVSKTRAMEVVKHRKIAQYFCRSLTACSLNRIGSLTGGRHHATILHACRYVKDQIEVSRSFRKDISEIRSFVNGRMEKMEAREHQNKETGYGKFIGSPIIGFMTLRAA